MERYGANRGGRRDRSPIPKMGPDGGLQLPSWRTRYVASIGKLDWKEARSSCSLSLQDRAVNGLMVVVKLCRGELRQ